LLKKELKNLKEQLFSEKQKIKKYIVLKRKE